MITLQGRKCRTSEGRKTTRIQQRLIKNLITRELTARAHTHLRSMHETEVTVKTVYQLKWDKVVHVYTSALKYDTWRIITPL